MNGLQTARILANKGIPVIGIAKDPKHYCCRTRVCDRILIADHGDENLIEALEKLGAQLTQKAVLYPCLDPNVFLVSKHRQRLENWYHIVLPAHKIVEKLMNKVSFYKYAQEKGLPISVTRFLDHREDAEIAAKELNYPCVLKPPVRSKKWGEHSWLKAYKVSTPKEFLEVYDRVSAWADSLIVQEWVVGPEDNLYSCNCYFNGKSEPIVTFVAKKLRQWPPITGESSLGEECRNDIVLNETVQLFQKTGYRGLGYVEFKKDERSGKYFIIEPNIGRPTGRSAIAEAGGVEILYTMYCDAVGYPMPKNIIQQYQGVKWMGIRRDLQSALYHWRQGNLTIRDWWKTVKGKKTYALFSWTDPGPFIADLYRAIKLFLKPEERGKRNYDQLISKN
jgi:D-aspartate ligase